MKLHRYEVTMSPGEAVLTGLAVFAMGMVCSAFLMYSYSLYDEPVQPPKPEVTVKPADVHVQPNLSGVEDRINDLKDRIAARKEAGERYSNNIQPAHVPVHHYTVGDTLKVDGIDKCLTVNGKSMQPTMFSDNVVCQQEYDGSIDLEEGMIVTYEETPNDGDSDYITHRIEGDYEDTSGELWMHGDNNRYGEMINVSQVEYVAKTVIFK